MIESESLNHTEIKELSISLLLNTIYNCGYTMDKNGDPNQPLTLHFTRPLGNRFYPHFHLKFDLETQVPDLHLDTRRHRADDIHSQISVELERLYKQFMTFSEMAPELYDKRYLMAIGKRFIRLAMFGSAEIFTNRVGLKAIFLERMAKFKKQQRVKKGPNKQKVLHKKYQYDGGVVEDWEPIEI